MLQRTPGLSPDQVKARLMKTASKSFPVSSWVPDTGVTYCSNYDIFTVGAAALNNADVAQGLALSPRRVTTPPQAR